MNSKFYLAAFAVSLVALAAVITFQLLEMKSYHMF